MKKIILFCSAFAICLNLQAQFLNTDTLKATGNALPVYNIKLYSDTNATSFFIEIKSEVKPHIHRNHSEHVYVMDGEADMLLGEQIIKLRKGSFVFIPQNTIHAVRVTSVNPLKILSVQSPNFDGSDRIFVEHKW